MRPTRIRIATATLVVALCSSAVAQESGVPAATVAPAPTPEAPAALPTPPRPAEPSWELRPYNVAVSVTFTPSPWLSDSVRDAFTHDLRQRLMDDYGAMWRLTLTPAEPANVTTESLLTGMKSEAAKARWLEAGADKVIPLSVEVNSLGWQFAAREWDRLSESLGPLQKSSAVDDRLAISSAAGLIKQTFRALAQVDAVAGRNVTLRMRAGELMPPDASATQVDIGNFLTPFVRLISRKGELQRVQPIAWTLLRVESLDRARANVLNYSVFAGAVAPTKKRMESMAIESRPTYAQTELQVVPRTNKGNPLAAARVDIVDRLATPDDPAVDRTTMRTDRNGVVTVPADPTPQVRYAIVHSGTGTLARVPFCPGMEPKLVVEVMDDAPRLTAEGEVSLLEADLIELVARRKVLLLRGDASAKAGKVDEVKALVAELRSLPTQPQFQQRIDLARTSAVEGAKERKDTVMETRIRKMYATLGEASKTHLDDDKFQETLKDLEDVASLRSPDRKPPGGKK